MPDAAAAALALLAIAALGLGPTALTALYIAAVTPELIRVDLREHRLPHRMVLPGLLIGAVGCALQASWLPLVAGLAFGGFLLVLGVTGGIGMGDVKLATLLGLGSPTLAVAVASPLLAFLGGGIAALVVLIARGPGARLPFGPALLGGYWVAVTLAGSMTGWAGVWP